MVVRKSKFMCCIIIILWCIILGVVFRMMVGDI